MIGNTVFENFEYGSIKVKCIPIKQPIGTMYICALSYTDARTISTFDYRRLEKDDLDRYIGIQREVDGKRKAVLQQYVKHFDACFPTSLILSIKGRCAEYNEDKSELTISSYPPNKDYPNDNIDEDEIVSFTDIATILDGQHRLAGLEGFEGVFELNSCIFIDLDIAGQAQVFKVVNLAQTKVNKSLALDLYEYDKTRSPEKLCHQLAVEFNSNSKCALYRRIKRLGAAVNPEKYNETIAQATFIKTMLPYLSSDSNDDRDRHYKGKELDDYSSKKNSKAFLRKIYLRSDDNLIAEIFWNFFKAVKARWPIAWESEDTGIILGRTNGFKALMKYFYTCCDQIANVTNNDIDKIPSYEEFYEQLEQISLQDSQFNTDNFKPGTSGQTWLYKSFISKKLVVKSES